MLEILVVCPARAVTGGPEALHAFVYELNQLKGVHARIWYWGAGNSVHGPPEYKSYHCEYVNELPEGFDGVLVVPEIWANSALDYDCIRAIYWLGVDAYAKWTQRPERGKFLQDENIIHIAQSDYAFDFLRKLGVKRIVKHTDIVNADFYADYEEHKRCDAVLYNPAKATPFMHQLMSECHGIEFRPIAGMTRAEVIDTMRHSKLYVDFGEFPGRERIPREAALCGCCIITSKIGAAGYDGDFMHSYKFESKPGHIWAIENRIRYVLSHYEECRKDFDAFRNQLRSDADNVIRQAQEVVDEIQHYYSGV